jgi:UDP-GlcNAc:undecaprenyl-phosphate GlcNAc-1-phosphate transferase
MVFQPLLAEVNPDFLRGFRAPLASMAIALIVVLVLTPLVKRLAFRFGAIDDPKSDDRRVHKEPTPRWGGIAIVMGVITAVLVIFPLTQNPPYFPVYLLGIMAMSLVLLISGALDDLHAYSAKIQALIIIACALAVQFINDGTTRVQFSGFIWPLGDQPHWVSFGVWTYPITAMYIFVVTKTMDTIDGIDGLTAGIAAISGATLCVIAVGAGQPQVALVAAAIAGAALGFLRYNYHPATIFMGTGGAQVLGFMLACLSLVGAMKTAATVAILVPILIFGVPLMDAVNVTLRRAFRGIPITKADKRHVHHELLKQGLNQRQVVWVLYIAAICLAGVLLVVVRSTG